MDIKEFKAKYPDLYQAIFDEGSKAGYDNGFAKGGDAGAETVDVEKIKAEAKEEGRNEAMEKTKGIMDLCALAGMPQMASALIEKKASVEDARKEILAAKADQSGDDEINSTVGAMSTGEVNPLFADAQRRAKAAGKEV